VYVDKRAADISDSSFCVTLLAVFDCVQDKMDGFVATHFFGWWLKVRITHLSFATTHFVVYVNL